MINVQSLSMQYGSFTALDNVSFQARDREILGLLGPNGAGKTTLLEILLARAAPDAGSLRVGKNIEIAYVDQNRALLDPKDTIWEALAPQGGDQVMVRGRPRHVAGYAKEFLFQPAQLRQPVGSLSGGERNRLALAVSMTRKADLCRFLGLAEVAHSA